MASEEDKQKAVLITQRWVGQAVTFSAVFPPDAETLVDAIATAITAARAETWEKAIMFVNIADIGDAKGADATYKIGKMLEAAAGSSREDEQKNSENQESE